MKTSGSISQMNTAKLAKSSDILENGLEAAAELFTKGPLINTQLNDIVRLSLVREIMVLKSIITEDL